MSNPYYDLYVESVMALARSLVIKDSASAERINEVLKSYGFDVNDLDPKTWKYYLNMAGIAHAVDPKITVRSLDTLELIPFTRESLSEHPATLEEYYQGSEYYEELVRLYPRQEALIRGVVSPVDLDVAVKAKDGDILSYDHRQVESNESNLILELEKWIHGFYVRWNIPEYSITDDLYNASFMGILYGLLPQAIMNIRLENCKTNYVHSFHVRQYLASNGKLDVYMDRLTKKQQLWLYRNANYLARHAGRTETFHTLIENLLTERGVALAAYDMRHNLSDILEQMRPKAELNLEFLNYDVGADYRDVREVQEILDKEILVARDNQSENDDAYEYVPRLLRNSMADEAPTKVLESIVSDNSGSTAFSFEQIVLHNWLYLSAIGRYNAVINIAHPVTSETITLTAQEAFIAYLYAYNKVCGFTLTKVPLLTAPGVKRLVTPTLEDLAKLVDPKYVKTSDLERAFVEVPPTGVYNSVTAFRDYCYRLRDFLRRHREIYILKEHPVERGQLEGALRAFWQDVDCDFNVTNYPQWFLDRSLDFHLLPDFELRLLIGEIYQAATGSDLEEQNSLRHLQDAMVGIMAQMSSYSVQYLKTITSNTFIHAEWAAIRVGDIAEKGYVSLDVRNAPLEVLDLRVKGRDNFNSRLGNYSLFKMHGKPAPLRVRMEVVPEYKFSEMTYAKIRLPTAPTGVIGFKATPLES